MASRDPEVGCRRRVQKDFCDPTPTASQKLRFNHPALSRVTVIIIIIIIKENVHVITHNYYLQVINLI